MYCLYQRSFEALGRDFPYFLKWPFDGYIIVLQYCQASYTTEWLLSPGVSAKMLPTMHLFYGPCGAYEYMFSLTECIYWCVMTWCTQYNVIWSDCMRCWRDNDWNVSETWVFTHVLVCHVVSSWQTDMRLVHNEYQVKTSLSSEACIVFSVLVWT